MKSLHSYLFLISFVIISCTSNTDELTSIDTNEMFTFKAVSEPSIAGTISPNLESYSKGTTITITAFPNTYFQFKNWSSPISSNENPITITLTKNTNVTAIFQKIDTDEDGVENGLDKCSKSLKGAVVDEEGCSEEEKKDDDGDGVINGVDICKNTEKGVPVNNKGCATIKDIDGNSYGTIKIGTQIWMSENLKATRYKDKTPIKHLIDNTAWRTATEGAYSNIYNNNANSENYGKVYNWTAVAKHNGICPEGWKVPSKEDWEELITFAGGSDIAGGKLKEEGTAHWTEPNDVNATNDYGFAARGGGIRFAADATLQFHGFRKAANIWTLSEDRTNLNNAYLVGMNILNISIRIGTSIKNNGANVRCIKVKK